MLLRDFIRQDKDRLLHIMNDSNVTKFLSSRIPVPYTSEDANWWIDDGSKLSYVKAIEIDGVLAGCIGVDEGDFAYQKSAEIGYWLAPEYWRKGAMTRAVLQMVSLIFDTTEITTIFANVLSDNVGSMKVLEKCGFEANGVRCDAIYKGARYYDTHVFVIHKTSPNIVYWDFRNGPVNTTK